MIFLTTGTLFPFDRLIKAVDDACGENLITEEIFAQIGKSSYVPGNFECVASLEKQRFDELMIAASCVISHAGMGSIIGALENARPLLVMPRLRKYGEHVNDHQVGTARKFEELGHILVAWNTEELPEKVKLLKTFVPKKRDNQAGEVAARISEFLRSI